jgi:hypothetical protein
MVGLVIVILGGIAVSSVTRVFVHQKIRNATAGWRSPSHNSSP